jgi:hypothetical protein
MITFFGRKPKRRGTIWDKLGGEVPKEAKCFFESVIP